MSGLGERSVRIREVEGSNPFRSTKRTLDEHLLFQRRFRRWSSLLMSKQEKRVKVMKPWLSFYRLRHLGCLPAASATLRMPPGFPHCRSRFGFPKPNVLQRNKQDQYKQRSSAKNQPALLSSLPPFPCDISPVILFTGGCTRRRLGCWSGLFVVHRGFSVTVKSDGV